MFANLRLIKSFSNQIVKKGKKKGDLVLIFVCKDKICWGCSAGEITRDDMGTTATAESPQLVPSMIQI